MSLPPPLEPVDAPPALPPTIDSSASTPPSPFPPGTTGTGSTPTGATFPSPTTTTNGSTLAPPPRPSGLPPGPLAALIVGVVIGAGTVLVAVCIFVIFYRRRKGKLAAQDLPIHGPKHDPSSDPPQNWQLMAPPPTDYDGPLLSKPTPPPGILATPPTDNYAPDKNFPNPSPGISSGFSQTSFSYEDLKLATDNFSEANLLGQGGFGYVHKGVLPNGKEVAIKQLKAGSGQGEREFQAEVDIIGRVHHRHLVTLVGYCISGAQRLLVYEFVSNKTMEFHLHGKERPVMDWPTRMKIALGSARGLAYLHEDCHPKIIHRDIKAANILLDDDFEAKVADFGLAKYSLDTDTHVSTRVMGTFGYLAPEYASSGKLTEKSDIFSFGVLLLELITGLRPIDRASSYVDDSMVDWVKPLLTQALEDGNFDAFVDRKLQEYDSSEMTRMVACAAACVRHSARRRPRMSQVVRALEGDMPLDDLTEGIKPGHSRGYSSHSYDESSEYNTMQYKEDMKKFRKLALESECSGPTSDFGPNPSSSSTEGLQTTQEMEVRRKSERDDSVVIVHVLDDEDEQPPPTSSSTEGQQTS